MTKKEFIERYGEEAYQRRLEYVRKYREQHRDEIKQYREQHREEYKQYREEHREERKQYQKQYNQQHREEYKQYREEHREERKQYWKQYNQQHREEHKQYREEHREERKQWNRKHIHMFAYCIPEQIEQIENYQFAKKVNFDGWDIHHRLETHNSDGEKRLVNLSKAELIALDMYYNRPANELVFLTKSEHMKLHKRNRNSKANA